VGPPPCRPFFTTVRWSTRMALVAPGVSNWSLTCVFSSLHSMVQDKPHVAVTTDSCLPSSRRKKIACTRSRGDDLGVSVCHFLPHQVLSSWPHVFVPTLPFPSVAFSPSVAFFSISHCCPWCSLFQSLWPELAMLGLPALYLTFFPSSSLLC
jgi:hypothetical protein